MHLPAMIRNGKIARLPRRIREQLNRRLDDGEQGAPLVEWLNRLPEVNLVVQRDFNNRPITEQNLSEWRQGGFLEWQKQQESCDWVRTLAGDAEQLVQQSGVMPISDRLSSMAALSLGKLIPALAADALSDADKRDDFWRLLRELARLRRDDFEATRVRSHLELSHAQRRNARIRRGEIDDEDNDL
jgi:hypothetical protein